MNFRKFVCVPWLLDSSAVELDESLMANLQSVPLSYIYTTQPNR
jgi:hypothetical protein